MSAVGESDEWNVTRQDKNVIWIWVGKKKTIRLLLSLMNLCHLTQSTTPGPGLMRADSQIFLFSLWFTLFWAVHPRSEGNVSICLFTLNQIAHFREDKALPVFQRLSARSLSTNTSSVFGCTIKAPRLLLWKDHHVFDQPGYRKQPMEHLPR